MPGIRETRRLPYSCEEMFDLVADVARYQEFLPWVVATRVRSDSETGGVHPGDRTDTWWWSPRLAMALRWDIDMHIGGPASLDTRATLTLTGTTPAV